MSNVKRLNSLRRGDITVHPNEILATKVIYPNDERNHSEIFYKAKMDEIRGLNRRKTWSIVNSLEVPGDANVIRRRFANVLKNAGTEKSLRKHVTLRRDIEGDQLRALRKVFR